MLAEGWDLQQQKVRTFPTLPLGSYAPGSHWQSDSIDADTSEYRFVIVGHFSHFMLPNSALYHLSSYTQERHSTLPTSG